MFETKKRFTLKDFRKDEIRQAALSIFSEKGISNVTLDDIAQTVGCSKGGITYYYSSKEALITDAFESFYDKIYEKTYEEISKHKDPLDKLLSFHWLYDPKSDQIKAMWSLALDIISASNDNEMYRTSFQAWVDRWVNIVKEIIQEGISTGKFQIEDLETTAKLISSTAQGIATRWHLDREHHSTEWAMKSFQKMMSGFLNVKTVDDNLNSYLTKPLSPLRTVEPGLESLTVTKNLSKDLNGNEKILNAALTIFSKQSSVNVTLESIAKEAGMTKGGIGYYYSSKEELFKAFFIHYFTSIYDRSLQHMAEYEDPCQKVMSNCWMFDSDDQEAEVMFPLVFDIVSMANHNNEFRQVFQDWVSDWIAILIDIIEKGNDAGQFQIEDVEDTARLISAAMQGIGSRWVLHRETHPTVWAQESLNILVKTFLPQKSLSKT